MPKRKDKEELLDHIQTEDAILLYERGIGEKAVHSQAHIFAIYLAVQHTPIRPPIAENEKHVFSNLMIQVVLFATSILKPRKRGQRCNATAADDPLFYTTI